MALKLNRCRGEKKLHSSFHVVMIRHDDGERLPIILDAERSPIIWVNEYLIKLRRSSVAAKTLLKELYVLGYFHELCKHAEINLIERLHFGKGFTADEITVQIFNWMRRNFGARRGRKVVQLVVARETVDYRMDQVWRLIKWHMENVITRLELGDNRIDHVQAKIKAMKSAFDSIRTDISNHNVEKLGLSSHRIDRLLAVCYPGHVENPWKKCYQERNYLILVMLLSFGFRRGELLKIKLRDLRLHGLIPEIRIVRRPDDAEDSRTAPPEVKTEQRLLPCDKFLAQRLQRYITKERKGIPGASSSPFLILARSGLPMSEKRINGIFDQLGKKHQDYADVHPHLCRHTCNTQLQKIARVRGLSDKEVIDHLKFLNGWRTDNSGTYTQAEIQMNAQNFSLLYQQNLFIQFADVPF